MNERFELSFKNKVVRMWFILIGPTVVIQISLTLFTELPQIIPAAIPIVPLTIFFVWYYFYKREQKKKQTVI